MIINPKQYIKHRYAERKRSALNFNFDIPFAFFPEIMFLFFAFIIFALHLDHGVPLISSVKLPNSLSAAPAVTIHLQNCQKFHENILL